MTDDHADRLVSSLLGLLLFAALLAPIAFVVWLYDQAFGDDALG